MERVIKIRVKFIELQGDIIALFPDELYNKELYGKTMIMSYQHIGQHSAASRTLMHCKAIRDDRITPLYNELIAIGYAPYFSFICKPFKSEINFIKK